MGTDDPLADIAAVVATIARLEAGQARNVRTIRNILRDHATAADFAGVALERAGGRVPRPDRLGGGYFDHIGEMVQSVRDLRANVRRLRNSLADPAHPADVRAFVESQIRLAEDMMARMEAALGG